MAVYLKLEVRGKQTAGACSGTSCGTACAAGRGRRYDHLVSAVLLCHHSSCWGVLLTGGPLGLQRGQMTPGACFEGSCEVARSRSAGDMRHDHMVAGAELG